MYRSFIANNKDFCILTVSELPIKRWLWGEGPTVCRNVWCGAHGVRWDGWLGLPQRRAAPHPSRLGPAEEGSIGLEGRERGGGLGLGSTEVAGAGGLARSCPCLRVAGCCLAVFPHVPRVSG